MSGPVIVAAWPKSGRETLQVRLDTFKGHDVLDCRAWYVSGDGELKPGRSGLTIGIRHLPQLAEALARAVNVAMSEGLLPDENASEP